MKSVETKSSESGSLTSLDSAEATKKNAEQRYSLLYKRPLKTEAVNESLFQQIEQLSKAEFDQIIASDKKLIVVDFFATWCGPCKAIAPHLVKWSEEFDDVTFIKIDVDENDETAESCNISAMPTFHFYKDGKKVDEIVGANHEKIKAKIMDLK